jgi:hypothetical protein
MAEKTKKVEVVRLSLEALEARVAPSALPAAEAFCAGGAWNSPQGQVVRFIQDPCLTIDHPMGVHLQ